MRFLATRHMVRALRLRSSGGAHGEMAEWSKAHAWKVCIRQKRIKGSNPFLSATHPNKSLFLLGIMKSEKIVPTSVPTFGGGLLDRFPRSSPRFASPPQSR